MTAGGCRGRRGAAGAAGAAGDYRGLQGTTGDCWGLQGTTGDCWGRQGGRAVNLRHFSGDSRAPILGGEFRGKSGKRPDETT